MEYDLPTTDGEPDIEAWCDEFCPDLYNPGMFDDEEVADEIWDALQEILNDTVIIPLQEVGEETDELEESILDAAEAWFKEYHNTMIEAQEPVSEDRLTAFRTKPQVAQHSAEWYSQRRNRLTASEFSQILDGRRGALKQQKVNPADTQDRFGGAPVALSGPRGELVATDWGHRFEPVTRDIYELEIAGVGTVCDTLGRFTHREYQWLSASPDGIVMRGPLAGRLVEIKSPKTRQPGKYVPNDYYVQMQIQMEVCDLEAVDFVEAQFAQRPTFLAAYSGGFCDEEMEPAQKRSRLSLALTAEETVALNTAAWKGRIEVYGNLGDMSSWRYRYSRPTEDLADAVFPDPEPTGLPLLESSVWWLTGWFPRTVLRNEEWWTGKGWPAAELFWSEVVSAQERAGKMEEEVYVASGGGGGGWLGAVKTKQETQP